MRIEHKSEKEIKEKMLEIIGKYLDLDKYDVFFFGSRVTGKGDDRSDIDVAIEGEKEIPIKILSDIKEEVENLPILYTIDVVDMNQTSESFRKVAKEKIESLI